MSYTKGFVLLLVIICISSVLFMKLSSSDSSLSSKSNPLTINVVVVADADASSSSASHRNPSPSPSPSPSPLPSPPATTTTTTPTTTVAPSLLHRPLPRVETLYRPCQEIDVDRQVQLRRHLPNVSTLPGFEIGGSHAPIFSRKEAPFVLTIDHDTKENIIAKYKGEGLKHFSTMLSVDVIFNSFTIRRKSLKELILNATGGKKLSWGVSSHVLEHMTDLIGFLNDIADVTTDDAVFVNAVPDKRKTFDYALPLKTYDSMIEDHTYKRRRHTKKVIRQFYEGSRNYGNQRHRFNDAQRDAALEQHRNGSYVDVHNLVVSPIHFLAIVNKLRNNGLLKWNIGFFQASWNLEFFVVFSKKGNPLYDNLNQDALEEIAGSLESEPSTKHMCFRDKLFDWARNRW